MAENVKLRPYQRQGIAHLANNLRACLFYDPGLGKTITTLLAIVFLMRQKKIRRVLIVAPLRVAQSVWVQEIEKWAETSHLTAALLHGPRKAAALDLDVDVHVINYEGLQWLLSRFEKDEPMPWDVVVFDELSKLKNTSTKRHKMLRRIIHKFPRRWGLTGTPAPNSLLELFGQMQVIDSALLGSTRHRFEQQYFMAPFPGSFDRIPRRGAEAAIAARLAKSCHRLSAADHLDVMDPIKVHHRVDLGRYSMDVYEELEKHFVSTLDTSTTITAASAGVVWGKLQQIAQGFLYDEYRAVTRINTAKLEVLEDIIEEAAGQPVLVFYRFQEDLEALRGGVGMVKYDPSIEAAWNRGEIKVMGANPASAGHGLNLQAGGHIIVWYTMEPSLEKYIQGNGRLLRQGQANQVVIHHLIGRGTVDEDTLDVLEKRATMQSLLLSRIKRLQSLTTAA